MGIEKDMHQLHQDQHRGKCLKCDGTNRVIAKSLTIAINLQILPPEKSAPKMGKILSQSIGRTSSISFYDH